MELNNLVEKIKGHSTILVVGPPRSGTRIGTQILASECGKGFVGEETWQAWEEDYDGSEAATYSGRWVFRMYKFLKDMGNQNVVIQAPGLTPWVHYFGYYEGIAVVLMKRDLEEILYSWKHNIGKDGTDMLDHHWMKEYQE